MLGVLRLDNAPLGPIGLWAAVVARTVGAAVLEKEVVATKQAAFLACDVSGWERSWLVVGLLISLLHVLALGVGGGCPWIRFVV